MKKFLSILKAVTVVVPVIEGLYLGVRKAVKEIGDAFNGNDPLDGPGGTRII